MAGMGESYSTGPASNADNLRELCRGYLKSRQSTLWGYVYTITDEDGLDHAVEFLASAIEGVMAHGRDDGKLRCEVGGYTFVAERPMTGGLGCREVTVMLGGGEGVGGKVMDVMDVDGGRPMTPERLLWIGREWVAALGEAMQELR